MFIRWADHLVSPAVNQRLKALLVLLSIGHFKRVIETLHNMRYISLAALFSEACLQFGMLQADQPQNCILVMSVCPCKVVLAACVRVHVCGVCVFSPVTKPSCVNYVRACKLQNCI